MDSITYQSLPEKVADLLGDMLYTENYQVGAKLPSEPALARRYSVSRGTIRFAIRILVERGILEVERGSGTFVSRSMGVSSDPLHLSLISDKRRLVKDLLDLRLMIEPELAALAAQRATGDDVNRLGDICRRMERAIHKGEHYLTLDMEFHTCIASSSGNLVVHQLYPAITQTLMLEEKMVEKRFKQVTSDAHQAIYQAIRDHKPSEARYAMLAHLLDNRRRIEASFPTKDASGMLES